MGLKRIHKISKAKSIDSMKSIGRIRKIFDRLQSSCNIQQMDDWYKITTKDIRCDTSYAVLKRRRGLFHLLPYAHYPWYRWKFQQLPRDFWKAFTLDTFAEIQHFVEWLSEQLQLRSLDDWYRVSGKQLQKFVPTVGFGTTILPNWLQRIYPEHNWDISKLIMKGTSIKASRRELAATIHKIFPELGMNFK
jgi:hypothetical protein